MHNKVSKCLTCGYEWLTGQHGGHSCTDQLLAEIARLKGRIIETGKTTACKKRRVLLAYVITQYRSIGSARHGAGAMYRDLEPGELLTSEWIMGQAHEVNKENPDRDIKITGVTILED